MTDKKLFSKRIANDIACTAVDYVLESILNHDIDNRQYSLETTADSFTDNFMEDLQEIGLIVTEYRIKIISECFEKQLEKIRDKVKSIKDNNFKKYAIIREKGLD